jgi:hypothetical protein
MPEQVDGATEDHERQKREGETEQSDKGHSRHNPQIELPFRIPMSGPITHPPQLPTRNVENVQPAPSALSLRIGTPLKTEPF